MYVQTYTVPTERYMRREEGVCKERLYCIVLLLVFLMRLKDDGDYETAGRTTCRPLFYLSLYTNTRLQSILRSVQITEL